MKAGWIPRRAGLLVVACLSSTCLRRASDGHPMRLRRLLLHLEVSGDFIDDSVLHPEITREALFSVSIHLDILLRYRCSPWLLHLPR